MKTKTKMTHKIAAAVSAGMMMGASTDAFAMAVTDANALLSNITKSSKGFTDMISLLGYIGGSGFSVAGIFKLKQHVDAPANHPLKDGVMRLAAGGALLSLPFIISVMQGSIGQGSSNTGAAVSKVTQFN
jgi:hypothetical protein